MGMAHTALFYPRHKWRRYFNPVNAINQVKLDKILWLIIAMVFRFTLSSHLGDDNQDCNPLGSNLAHASFPNEGSNFIHFNYMNTWNGKPDVHTVFLACITPYLIFLTLEYPCFYLPGGGDAI